MNSMGIKFFAGILAMAMLASSCEKSALSEEHPAAREERGHVTIVLGGSAATKVTSVNGSDESRIERWAYWVFDGDNRAVKCGTGTGDHSSVTLLTGFYTVVVIANYPTSGLWMLPVSAGGTREELLGRISDLSCNSYGHFVMKGEVSVTVREGERADIEVKLARLVSKVGIRRIAVRYDNPRLSAMTTVLKGIYLTNLYRTTRLGEDFADTELSDSRSSWYNSMGWHRWEGETISSGIDALVGDRGLSFTLTPSQAYTAEHFFYCYPNPSEAENDTNSIYSWCIRSSRLIIETEVDGVTYYYHIRIPAMKRNTPYIAKEAVIRNLGSLDPEEIIPGALDVTFSTEVNDSWEGDYFVDEES